MPGYDLKNNQKLNKKRAFQMKARKKFETYLNRLLFI
jgi:hypothetical protein